MSHVAFGTSFLCDARGPTERILFWSYCSPTFWFMVAVAMSTTESDRTARVSVLVSEIANERFLAHPIAAPAWASVGGLEDVLAEQAVFFRELFARAAPSLVSRLSLPDSARLMRVEVLLPRADIPHRRELTTAVEVACVVVDADPQKNKDVWVIAPRVGHTFYVAEGEPLEEAIRSEVRRVVAAQDLTPWELMGYFPPDDERLEVIQVRLDEAETAQKSGESLRKTIAEKAARNKAVEALLQVSAPLHATMRGYTPPPLFGRELELRSLRALLDGEDRQSVLLIGPEQSGKSALMSTFVTVSTRLVYATSGAQLIAGMGGLGEWQERIGSVLAAIAALDAVLYFDDLEDLLSERTESGGVDFAGSIRPWVEEGKIRLVGEVRRDRLAEVESRYPGFFSSLRQIRVDPLSAAAANSALDERAAYDARREPSRPRCSASALRTIVELSDRYWPYDAFPGKALRLYHSVRDAHDRARGQAGPGPVLESADVIRLFSFSTGVPEMLLSDDIALRVEDLSAALRKQIIGQEQAVATLASTIGVVKAGLQPTGKPLATFLFVGPTGVGKTELARALAERLFGAADRLVRFDMTEMATADGAERLIRGVGGADGLLTRKIRQQPFCVLLLDEIEKAHPLVFDLLLQVCGEGRLTDASGKTAYFHNTIVIMTSNLGATERRTSAGFGRGDLQSSAVYERAVHSAFRPEFVNRIDRIVPFRSLTQGEVLEVARLGVEKLKRRRGLAEGRVSLIVSPAALSKLAEEGYSPAYGARAMRRCLDDHLAEPLARALANAAAEKDGLDRAEVFADVVASGEAAPPLRRDAVLGSRETGAVIDVLISRKRSAKTSEMAVGERQIAALRREAEGWLELEPVVALRDQVALLVSELGRSGTQSKGKRLGKDDAAFLAEHHRLSEIVRGLEEAQEALRAAEEVGLLAFFEGQEVWSLLEDARRAHRELAQMMPAAMLCLEPARDAVVWVLEELDEGAFDTFLPTFLDAADARQWMITAHIDGDDPKPGDVWPVGRRWGPPRTSGELRAALGADNRGFRGLVLRVKGPLAGVTLALEAGLHRMVLPKRQAKEKGQKEDKGAETLHVEVRAVGFFFDIPDEAWTHEALRPPHPASASTRRHGAAARELRYSESTVFLLGKKTHVDLNPWEYWASLGEVTLAHLVYLERDDSEHSRSEWLNLPTGLHKKDEMAGRSGGKGN